MSTGVVVARINGREFKLVAGMAAIEEIEERLNVPFDILADKLASGLKTRETREIFAALAGITEDEAREVVAHVGVLAEVRGALLKAIEKAAPPKPEGEELDGGAAAEAATPPPGSLD